MTRRRIGLTRRRLAAVLVAGLAMTGIVAIATAEPASAGPCDALGTNDWLGSWQTDNGAESGDEDHRREAVHAHGQGVS